MTPKEKARELLNKMNQNISHALIAVDEIIRVLDEDFDDYRSYYIITVDEYWQEVKQEMEKL